MTPKKDARIIIYLAEENKNNLITGEYYYKKEVKKITKQSYDLIVAQKLLDKLEIYLKGYISNPSLILLNGLKV